MKRLWVGLVVVWWVALLGAGTIYAQGESPVLVGLPGHMVLPLSETDVRMLSQVVVIEIIETTFSTNYGQQRFEVGGRVQADYVLQNPTEADISLMVGFPLYAALPIGVEGYYEIQDIAVAVNGLPVATFVTPYGDTRWATWEVVLPGQTEVAVQVQYATAASTRGPLSELAYWFGSGNSIAGWVGEIPQTEVRLRFPYTVETPFLSGPGLFLTSAEGSVRYDDRDMIWEIENFAPDRDDRIVQVFVSPRLWQPVLQARAVFAANPLGQNAWQLARAYAAIVTPEGGLVAPELVMAADEAYREALAGLPGALMLEAEYVAFVERFAGGVLPTERVTEIAPLQTAIAAVPSATVSLTPPIPAMTATMVATAAGGATVRPSATLPATPATQVPAPSATPNEIETTLSALREDEAVIGLVVILAVAGMVLYAFLRQYGRVR